MVSSARPKRSSASQQASTWEISAISAIEQPAFRSGRITCWPSRPSTSALSAIKCTPQKTMYLAPVSAADLRELVAVAGEVGKADHFVALVVVAQNHGRRAQLRARLGDAPVHGVVGKRQVVFKAASFASLSAQALPIRQEPGSQYSAFSPIWRTGMLKANRLQWMRCITEIRGLVSAIVQTGKPHPRGCCSPFIQWTRCKAGGF